MRYNSWLECPKSGSLCPATKSWREKHLYNGPQKLMSYVEFGKAVLSGRNVMEDDTAERIRLSSKLGLVMYPDPPNVAQPVPLANLTVRTAVDMSLENIVDRTDRVAGVMIAARGRNLSTSIGLSHISVGQISARGRLTRIGQLGIAESLLESTRHGQRRQLGHSSLGTCCRCREAR